MRTQFQTLNSLITISFVMTCLLQQVEQDFTRKLDELIKNLNQKKLKVYISGDINIDFLKCNGHSPTKDHLEMLYSNNFLPIITKPTSLKIRQL